MRAARNERQAHAFMDTHPTDPELQRWIDATEASGVKRKKPRRLRPVLRDLLIVLVLFLVAAVAALVVKR